MWQPQFAAAQSLKQYNNPGAVAAGRWCVDLAPQPAV